MYTKQNIVSLIKNNDRAVEKAIFSVYSSSVLKREHLSPIEYWITWMVGKIDDYSNFSEDVIKNRRNMSGKFLDYARTMMLEHYIDHLVDVANKSQNIKSQEQAENQENPEQDYSNIETSEEEQAMQQFYYDC